MNKDNNLRLKHFNKQQRKLLEEAFTVYTECLRISYPPHEKQAYMEDWVRSRDIDRLKLFVEGGTVKEVVLNWCDVLLLKEK